MATSFLSRVQVGRPKKPALVLIYGVDGVGKSTFGADAPNPIFLGNEDHGTGAASIPRVNTLEELAAALNELLTEEHDYKTLVIDSVDWIEPLLWDYIVRTTPVKHGEPRPTSIEDVKGGYGKGYVEAVAGWRKLFAKTTELREKRGMNIIFIGHAEVKPFQDPESNATYDRYQLKLAKGSAALLREYVDAVLFANYETFVKKAGKGNKHIAFADGSRVIHTERRAAYDAKNRLGLPEKLPLSWESFIEAAALGQPDSPASIRRRIELALEQLKNQETAAKARASLEQAGDDAARLARIEDKLNTILSEQPAGDTAAA